MSPRGASILVEVRSHSRTITANINMTNVFLGLSKRNEKKKNRVNVSWVPLASETIYHMQ